MDAAGKVWRWSEQSVEGQSGLGWGWGLGLGSRIGETTARRVPHSGAVLLHESELTGPPSPPRAALLAGC